VTSDSDRYQRTAAARVTGPSRPPHRAGHPRRDIGTAGRPPAAPEPAPRPVTARSSPPAPVPGPVRYRMTRDARTNEAATLTELVGRLIPGYAALPEGPDGDAAALEARWEQAVATANLVQAVLTVAAVEAGDFHLRGASEDGLTALFADRMNPLDVDQWTGIVPLVLVATSYSPFTGREPPVGNVRWINPHTERTYLESLAALGVIELGPVETAVGDDGLETTGAVLGEL
jgi:hypothetical protein